MPDDDNQYPVCPDCGQRHPPNLSDEDAAKVADQVLDLANTVENPIDRLNILMSVLVGVLEGAPTGIKLQVLAIISKGLGVPFEVQQEPQFAALKPGAVILPGNGSVN